MRDVAPSNWRTNLIAVRMGHSLNEYFILPLTCEPHDRVYTFGSVAGILWDMVSQITRALVLAGERRGRNSLDSTFGEVGVGALCREYSHDLWIHVQLKPGKLACGGTQRGWLAC